MLSNSISALIVDLFRMLYVLGSKEAKASNIGRFDIFFGMADDHARELSSLVGRMTTGITPENSEAIMRIERDCSWVLRQIRYRDDVNFDITMCFSKMGRVIDEVHRLLSRIIPDDLVRIEEEVDVAFRGLIPNSHPGSIGNMRIRFSVQSKILKNQSIGEKIQTIAHDASQEYAVHYFIIDRKCFSYPYGGVNQ